MTCSGPGPSPVGIPMPQSEGAKDMLALRGPLREAATNVLPCHPSTTPSPRPHVQKHSELGVAVQVTHAPKGGLAHQQPPPSSALMPEPLGTREISYTGNPDPERGPGSFRTRKRSQPPLPTPNPGRTPGSQLHWGTGCRHSSGPPGQSGQRAHRHTPPAGAAPGGSTWRHSAPDPVEPWPHGVASACPLGWTQRPLTWSCKFLLPRGPNIACARAHSATGETPQAAQPFSRSQEAPGEGVRLISWPWVPGDRLDLQEHLQCPGSKI